MSPPMAAEKENLGGRLEMDEIERGNKETENTRRDEERQKVTTRWCLLSCATTWVIYNRRHPKPVSLSSSDRREVNPLASLINGDLGLGRVKYLRTHQNHLIRELLCSSGGGGQLLKYAT